MKHSSIKLEKTKEPKMDVPRIVVKPGEGRSGSLGGMGVVFKVSGGGHGLGLRWRGTLDRIGGGSCCPMSTCTRTRFLCRGGGRISARVEDHEVAAGPGSYLIKPHRLMHTF
jgi:hypothetical protein